MLRKNQLNFLEWGCFETKNCTEYFRKNVPNKNNYFVGISLLYMNSYINDKLLLFWSWPNFKLINNH